MYDLRVIMNEIYNLDAEWANWFIGDGFILF